MSLADHPLAALRWQRLKVSLLCVRVSSAMSAHPIAVMNAIVKGVTISLSGDSPGDDEQPGVLFHLTGRRHTSAMRQGDLLQLEVFFCSRPEGYGAQWREALVAYLADAETGKNFELKEAGQIEERSLALLATEHPNLPTEGELCLDFLTPFPFKADKGKGRTWLSANKFAQLLESRITRLLGTQTRYQTEEDDFRLLPYYWNYTEIRHPSHSQPGKTQYLNGCGGRLYLRGRFAGLVPWLLLASELHVGAKLSNSLGYFSFTTGNQPFFCRNFPHQKALQATIRDVLERYDNAAESLALTESWPFSEEQCARDLCAELVQGSYTPAPATAFMIKKKDGGERLIEQLRFRDLIVQQYLHRLLADIADRFFDQSSIGYRKGMSRQKSVDMVREALKEGYCFLIESDIDDFFPSVDHAVLETALRDHLPLGDEVMVRLLMTCVRTGCVLNGKLVERLRGIAQGSPLSPLLANLYLDCFDDQVKSWNVRMIRFADDFIILTKTREEAEAVLERTEDYLAELKLALNQDKTAIRHVSEGFRFLGIRFDADEARDQSLEDGGQLKKPLYITEPYTFLSLNAGTVEVIKAKKTLESIPLRRVSEMIVLEKATFSTSLVKACADQKIPLTLTLNSGYFVATVKPDSKQYFDVAFRQGLRFQSLSDTEHLWIARQFAVGKLKNYIALFRQRYDAEATVHLIRQIGGAIESIERAGDVNQVRGHEGAIAKKVYRHLNILIDAPAFHLTTRGRMVPDRINALLNFGYYLLFTRINATLRAMGLNPYLGFLHSHHDSYESLACDVEELFRSRIDRLIIRCINLKVIKPEDFQEKDKRLVLNKDGTRKFIQQLEAELDRKNSRNELSLEENIHLQCQLVKRFFCEGANLNFYEWVV